MPASSAFYGASPPVLSAVSRAAALPADPAIHRQPATKGATRRRAVALVGRRRGCCMARVWPLWASSGCGLEPSATLAMNMQTEMHELRLGVACFEVDVADPELHSMCLSFGVDAVPMWQVFVRGRSATAHDGANGRCADGAGDVAEVWFEKINASIHDEGRG
jgi:hypothetical protein